MMLKRTLSVTLTCCVATSAMPRLYDVWMVQPLTQLVYCASPCASKRMGWRPPRSAWPICVICTLLSCGFARGSTAAVLVGGCGVDTKICPPNIWALLLASPCIDGQMDRVWRWVVIWYNKQSNARVMAVQVEQQCAHRLNRLFQVPDVRLQPAIAPMAQHCREQGQALLAVMSMCYWQ